MIAKRIPFYAERSGDFNPERECRLPAETLQLLGVGVGAGDTPRPQHRLRADYSMCVRLALNADPASAAATASDDVEKKENVGEK